MQIRTRFFGSPLGAKELGASLHELLPGSTGFNLHAHYGMEEMFFVLSGTPTLRTGDGEEELAPGDVVFCPRGIDGPAHVHESDRRRPRACSPSRRKPLPEVVLYPELGKVARRDAQPVRDAAARAKTRGSSRCSTSRPKK